MNFTNKIVNYMHSNLGFSTGEPKQEREIVTFRKMMCLQHLVTLLWTFSHYFIFVKRGDSHSENTRNKSQFEVFREIFMLMRLYGRSC